MLGNTGQSWGYAGNWLITASFQAVDKRANCLLCKGITDHSCLLFNIMTIMRINNRINDLQLGCCLFVVDIAGI